MRKLIHTFLAFIALSLFAGNVYAGSMTIKIEQPKSPTNLTSLNVNFVVLDYAANGAITARCWKKGPGDGGFSQFGSDMAITTGGNSANCVADGSSFSSEGTYQYYVTAENTGETVTSDTVSVERKTSGGPDTPTNYSKSRVNICDYKINFRTADDGGKTVKVEVYRSGETSFSADPGSRVDTITIGSNTDGSSTTTPPNCNQEFYFAVRAFDSIGNGSGLVGDSVTVTVGGTTTTTTTTTGSAGAGAIPAGTGGNILGVETAGAPTGPSGAILGEEASSSPTPSEDYTPPTPNLFTGKNLGWGVLGIAGILLVVWLLRKKQD
ncbi:hypothetical protein A2363_03905 [Candidatus Gottesmanbacteria bacterium RIFOXYB1_FULL_47_11]|uniref:Gram-positive cocci surface proteins LPxTG domain-containing protein n=1 Tax=Candidatus Gottesmanbacteria bacterium RIFOXYB1_FULL_47_11 TaxID=1798401 RepID=A0A1F6BE09_9BACT|nr:MAG: hypothetical protein A2363_03905 [Candidatus Gottesmanbacteria bacterium RIFOXYB1_FULL_47_11]